MGVPLRVGLSAASPRGATFAALHVAPLRAFRYYPSRAGSSSSGYYITFLLDSNDINILNFEKSILQKYFLTNFCKYS
ncbi:MAG: hypothetical protein LBB41_06220 [Prevotellaceae bacterium]|nr:hypothetical protein [Prevotellaceae bacterium]